MSLVRERKWVSAGIVGLVLAAAVMIWKPAGQAKAATTIKLFAPYSKAQFHDLDVDGDRARSAGDEQTGRLVFYRHGKKRGHFEFTCTLAASDPWRQVCTAGLRLSGEGMLTLATVTVPDGQKANVPLTGGTGSYTGATGTALLDFTGRRGLHVTIRLQ